MKLIKHYVHAETGKAFRVLFDIELEEIYRQLAAKAFTSKSKKAKAMGGSVSCKVVSNWEATVLQERTKS